MPYYSVAESFTKIIPEQNVFLMLSATKNNISYLSFVAQGLVSSKGQFGVPDCSYVVPNSGQDRFEFQIYYDKCGTKPDMGGKFYENTIIIQYDSDLIEVIYLLINYN